MKRRAGFVAAWLGATLVAVVVATAAVGSVRSEVTDEPTELGSPSAAALASDLPDATLATAEGSAPSGDAQTEITTTTAPQASVTSTTDAGSETSTTDGASGSGTTSSTTPPATTTSTQPETTTTTADPRASYSKTVETDGGSVTFLVEGETLSFGGAVPKTGWKVELEEAGPDEVKVKFEKNDDSAEIEVKGRLEDGELAIAISGDSDDD